MTTDTIPVAPLSIWKPIHLGSDELSQRVEVTLAERNMLIGGEPGGGKSVALQLIVAHGALSLDCRLILIDGKRVELGLWRDCADRFIGSSIDDAIDTMHWLQAQIDERTEWLLDHKMRKITPGLGWPVYIVVIDEVAYYSATVGTPDPAEGIQRLPTATSSPAAGHPASSPSRQPSGPPPTSSPPACATCSATGGPSAAPPRRPPTPSSATAGPTWATPPPRSTPRPAACPGSAPKTASRAGSRPPTCTDEQIIDLAAWAAQARSTHHARRPDSDAGTSSNCTAARG